MAIIGELIQQSHLNPEKIVIRDKDRVISSADFICDISNAAASLQNKKAKQGGNVILHAENSYAFICSYFAVHYLGARAVIVDSKAEVSFLKFIESKVNPCCIVTSPEQLLVPVEIENGSTNKATSSCIADILFTSGTTGEPKGVALSHQQLLDSTINIINKVGNDETDIELLLMPLSHSFGLGRMRSALFAGTTLVIGYPLNRMKQVFKAIKNHNITGFGIVPAAWEFIILMSQDLISKYSSQIKYIELGSAYFSGENKQMMCSWFPEANLVMHYGLTEVSRAIFSSFHSDPYESLGHLGGATEVRVLDVNSNILENGLEGEIALCSSWMLSEYLDNPELTKLSFADGYFKTGDLGIIDGEYLYLRGRLKEIINVGGKKVNPLDIESILKRMSLVSDCACVAFPDPQMGEVVKAFIVPSNEGIYSESEIKAYLQDKLPSHMRPRSYECVQGIPRTSNGKIQRLKLISK